MKSLKQLWKKNYKLVIMKSLGNISVFLFVLHQRCFFVSLRIVIEADDDDDDDDDDNVVHNFHICNFILIVAQRIKLLQ